MLGAIAGDIVGSTYEGNPIPSGRWLDFPLFQHGCRFTDDTVLTVATADAILSGGGYAKTYREYFRRYPYSGYGISFIEWARHPERGPYGSWGNGSAMRVSPIAWAAESLEGLLEEARSSALVTHNHLEGIKGAQAVAMAVFLARSGETKEEIRSALERRFRYDLSQPLEAIRPDYRFDVSCQGSVPPAIRAFLEGADFEHAIRLAVSLGGDSDTQACIAGAIAEAFFGGISKEIETEVFKQLDDRLRRVVRAFRARFPG